jgi:hypothetical protein
MEEIANWVAPAATTLAALMTASNRGARFTGYGFAVFLVGSIAWMVLGLATGQSNLVWQNAILTLLNIFGIWSWLFRRAKIDEGGRTARERSLRTPGETLFPASALTSATVAWTGGGEAGTAVDAMIGSRSGRIYYLVLTDGGVAGVGETFRRADWDKVRVDGGQLSLAISADASSTLPEISRDQWPGR